MKTNKNNDIHLNFEKLMNGKNMPNNTKKFEGKKEIQNTDIHNNYVKLMDGKNISVDYPQKENLNLESQHNEKIHDNYIKLMNSGYRTRHIKSPEDLKYEDVNKKEL